MTKKQSQTGGNMYSGDYLEVARAYLKATGLSDTFADVTIEKKNRAIRKYVVPVKVEDQVK